jgi:cell division protein FtsL
LATASRRSKSSNINPATALKNFIFSNQVFPFVLTFFILGLLFVLFRMKGVELDYKITSVNKDIDRVTLDNKELKAKKARLLSVKRLRKMASKYGLDQPRQKQIIVLPE